MHDPTHEYDDDCEGCQPAMLDVQTGEQMKKDHPAMVAVLKAWKEKLTLDERKLIHRAWMGQMPIDPKDQEILERVSKILQEAISDVEPYAPRPSNN